MSEQSYRVAFGIAVVICIVLAGALGFVFLHSSHTTQGTPETDPVVAKGPAVSEQTPARSVSEGNSAPVLSPVQLSPQRLQAIGVKTATVTLREINDQLRIPGNVDINEQQVSYVQTRFPGWIQKVFANATYQYVRKGQPLFTIY